jgi:hypothetical protein
MILLIAIFILYFLNVSILFQSQSMVVLIAFCILLMILSSYYKNLKSTIFQIEIVEWVENIQFYKMIKTWTSLLIRLITIKIYNTIILIKKLQQYAVSIIKQLFEVSYLYYIDLINNNAELNLNLLLSKSKAVSMKKSNTNIIITV